MPLNLGPLTFAQLQASELAQEGLNRLISNKSLESRGLVAVQIRGGANGEYKYANWLSPEKVRPECIKQETNSYTFSNAINPFVVQLSLDRCARLKENWQIKLFSLAAAFLLFLFSVFQSGIFLWPLMKSLKLTENLISGAGNSYGVESIPFLPIQRIAKIAISNLKGERDLAMLKIAQQVAHDIKSPLAALEMLSGTIDHVSEDKRIILRNSINRMRDIANSLLQKHDPVITDGSITLKGSNSQIEDIEPLKTELFLPLIDSLLTEKRLQYRDKLNLQLDFSQTIDSYGLFSRVQINEFKRVLSNLVDNAAESLPDYHGSVNVSVSTSEDKNVISVIDNGRGITEDILSKLGERGASFHKPSGSGLGLHHAYNAIRKWKGDLRIASKPGEGTRVSLVLPQEMAATWFVPSLNLLKGSTLVILDDDQSIHHIWQERLEPLESKVFAIHLSSPKEFKRYFGQHFEILADATFLIDYEFIDSAETGLDLIEELGIQTQAILVTSRYEESHIRLRCEKTDIKLIPKSMSGFVPIILI